jgi:intergrase/recombinase
MSEKSFWRLLRNNLPFKTYRVENKVMIGMPDVHYIHKGKTGWIELKYIPKWFTKRTRKLNCGYKLQQALWAKEHIKHGGTNWILIRVSNDFIGLVHGRHAMQLQQKPYIRDFYDICVYQKRGNLDDESWNELAHAIVNPSVP